MPSRPVHRARTSRSRLPLRWLAVIACLGLLPLPLPLHAASALLESVKTKPELARSLCDRFKQFNAEGKSATSREAIDWVAANQNLSAVDAEVLSTYVIGLHCPDVR
jgi:hypothetical protein